MKAEPTLFVAFYRSVLRKKRKEWNVIFACILVAASIWLLNALNKEYTTEINYPVRFIYNDTLYMPLQEPVRIVKLNVTANGWHLLKRTAWVKIPPINFKASETNESPYYSAYQLLPAVNSQISDLQINYVVTDSIRLEFSPIIHKKIKIVVDSASIKLENGYRLAGPINISPDSIELVGAKVALAALPNKHYILLPNRILEDDLEEVIPVNLPLNPLVKQINKDVLVSVKVTNGTYLVISVPVRKINFPDTVKCYVRVGYVLPKEAPAKLFPPDSFNLVADFNRANNGKIMIEILKFPVSVEKVNLIEPYLKAGKLGY